MNSVVFATACIMMRVTRLTYCDMGVFLILMTLLPIVLNEFFWSVGQSVYTYVYGHMGTNELAGMSLTGAVQGLTMGALSGLSQAAGNMILGGGIIRSGGKTKYVMMIDMMGTWLIGVPLALLTGLYLKLPVIWVYFVLSQEELVRLIVSVFMFRSRKWMHTLQ